MQIDINSIFDTNEFRKISGHLDGLISTYDDDQELLKDLSEQTGLVSEAEECRERLHKTETDLEDGAAQLSSMIPNKAEQRNLTSLLCLDLEKLGVSKPTTNLFVSFKHLNLILDPNRNPHLLDLIESNIREALDFTVNVLKDVKEYFEDKTNSLANIFLTELEAGMNNIIATEKALNAKRVKE